MSTHKRLLVLLCALLLAFAIYDGVERARLHNRISELEMGATMPHEVKEFTDYVQGVKVGLDFKKAQQGGVPCKEYTAVSANGKSP